LNIQQKSNTEMITPTTGNGKPERRVSLSQAVSCRAVHEFVQPFLDNVGTWPTVGTPEWCALPKDDRRRWAALLDASQHWGLHLEGAQTAMVQASHAISESAGVDDGGNPITWTRVAQEIRDRNEFRTANPWARRVAS